MKKLSIPERISDGLTVDGSKQELKLELEKVTFNLAMILMVILIIFFCIQGLLRWDYVFGVRTGDIMFGMIFIILFVFVINFYLMLKNGKESDNESG